MGHKLKIFRLISFSLLLFISNMTFADLVGKVVVIIDGDTIRVLDIDGVEHTVRLSAIDAPQKGQPFASESSEYLASLVASQIVTVESTSNDRLGQIIGKVLVDGNDVNLALVKRGYAWWYRDFQSEQSWEDKEAYEAAETSARKLKIGLWSDPRSVNPKLWKKMQKAYTPKSMVVD